ncbi:hypothetical protein [Alkalihalobacillus trypoxylicola]|uniref:Flagellar hook-length control protein-like C-terminal domain-containing protein n=1 Tax=Alkalihalobacillus trypoxylicola TaxID=519424 RepID=A0A162E9V3_9BACI|nr:hypothetical protein [Alkalihalobacillus trypoxylicola]KYG32121.1 hypothetical protein AZF04_04950 [Alkalihalobacillus trypoxylicola]
MQIHAQLIQNQNRQEPTSSLKKGEVHQAVIKEKLSEEEAIVSIKGKEMKARFQGGVPSSQRASVEIVSIEDGDIELKSLPHSKAPSEHDSIRASTQAAQQKLESLIGNQKLTPEWRQALQLLQKHQVSLSKERIQDIQRFLHAGNDISDRLQTLHALLTKKLEPTSSQLQAIHQALHGQALVDAVTNLTPSQSTAIVEQSQLKEIITQHYSQLLSNQSSNGQQMLLNELMDKVQASGLNINQKELEALVSQLRNDEPAKTVSSSRNDSAILNKISQLLQRQPDISVISSEIKSLLLTEENHLPSKHLNLLEGALTKAEKWSEQGRELTARQAILSALQTIENSADSSNYGNVNLPPAESKMIQVTTVTEKMAELTNLFKRSQREINTTLQLIVQQQSLLPNSKQSVPLLETVIKKLDHAIMKSEMMLFTDMKTERSLLQASSQLQEAKSLLQNGQFQQAQQLVRDVQRQIQQIQYQPSETKVHHVVAEPKNEAIPQHRAQSLDWLKSSLNPEGSSRNMFEMMRQMGLSREADMAHQLISQKESQQWNQNLKNHLMNLAKGDEDGNKAPSLAQQAVQNITGQQLLSRHEPTNHLQSMMFNLPFLLEDKVENIQLFLKARNGGDKLDWENCSLYFLMETTKLGEIGISLSAKNRSLSIILKNDQSDFEVRMKPYVDEALERLSEIGYSINGMKFEALTKETPPLNGENKAPEQEQLPFFTEEGFDFKI